MSATTLTRFSHKLFEPTPWTISEADTHCVMIFEKLRLQREQGRFCDVILKVYGREFPAHRCVLASCSPWFDTKLKVHKTLKEIIEVDSCKNYEVFHRVLTYMYTGQVVIDKHNVEDILEISHNYMINKLKNYCSEYLERNLKASNCLNVIELAEKYHLIDLSKQTVAYIHKHFEHIIQYHELEKKSLDDVQHYINRAWYFPSELVLRLVTRWTNQHASREDHFVSLLHNINWASLDPVFISHHLDTDPLYHSSAESLLTILHIMDKNNIKLASRYTDVYKELQERLLPEQELDDSNSFLSLAINSAVLEHSEVDETFSSYILQPDPLGDSNQYGPYRHPSGNEIEGYKGDTTDPNVTVDLMNFNPNSKKAVNQAEFKLESGRKYMQNLTSETPDNGNTLEDEFPGKSEMSSNNMVVNNEVVVSFRNNLESTTADTVVTTSHSSAGQCPTTIDGSQYHQSHLPSPIDAESSGAYRNSPGPACGAVYKNYDSSSQMNPQYYRQENMTFLAKSMPNDTGNDYNNQGSKCMDSVADSNFNPDLFKNSQMNREESSYMYREDNSRNAFMCQNTLYGSTSTSRESNLYQSEMEHYRNMEPQYDNYKSVSEEATVERTEYEAYKYDLANELKSGNSGVDMNSVRLQQEKLERLQAKSDFDFTEYQILEQVINEQRLSERSLSSTTTKRYDPKYRALAEAFRQTEPDVGNPQVSSGEIFTGYKHDVSCQAKNSSLQQVALDINFLQCRMSEKQKSREARSDCQYQEQLKTPRDDFVHVPTSTEFIQNHFGDSTYTANEADLYIKTSTAGSEHFPSTSVNTFQPPPPPSQESQINNDDPLQTPEKSDVYLPKEAEVTPLKHDMHLFPEKETGGSGAASSCGASDVKSTSAKSLVFLTPKEKYAKEVNAERLESVQRKVNFDTDPPAAGYLPPALESPPVSAESFIPISPQLEPLDTATRNPEVVSSSPVKIKHKLPLAFKILRAKKKMASQKKLILEHGEVRLTQKQKSKLKPPRKRSGKVLPVSQQQPENHHEQKQIVKLDEHHSFEQQPLVEHQSEILHEQNSQLQHKDPEGKPDDSFLPLTSKETTSITSADLSHKVKTIVNRKDKLLAEHRSQQSPGNCGTEEKVEDRLGGLDGTTGEEDPTRAKETGGNDLDERGNLAELVMDIDFTCPFCNVMHKLKKDYYKHIKEQHLTTTPYQCPKCEHKHAKINSILVHYSARHLATPTQQKPFACTTCPHRAATQLLLRRHVAAQHQQQQPAPRFVCEICRKAFSHRATLDQHRAVHTSEKKYKCKQCSFSTKYNSHLSAHRRMHEGNVHRCNFEQCQYWTPKLTLLKAHIRAHNGDKNFKCETCGKGFVEAGQLKRHMKTHSDDKPFKCEIDNCSYASKRRDKLKEHQSRAHKPKPDDSAKINRPSKMLSLNKSFVLEQQDLEFSPAEIPYVKEEIFGY